MSFNLIRHKVFLTLMTFVLSVFLVGNIFAQSGTTTVSGVVTDQSSAALPGATVTISNPATGFKRSTTTDNNGVYKFPGIPPATYRLEVEATGFKKAINTNVKALVDSSAVINVALETGAVTATVDVTTNTIESVVNTEDASLGNNFVPQQITQLPTNLRRVNDLLTLQPGVTRQGYVAGGRSDQSNITLDGVDINDQQTGGRTGQFQTSQGSVLRATTESVKEFRITTTNANANQGRSSGAQISLVTKSGTNDWHGSLFYFYRPTAFSANDFFNNAAGSYVATDQAVISGLANAGDQRVNRPSLARDVFGGSFGGPIKKDKLFFFYSYEGQRQDLGISTVRTVPMAHLGNGELRFRGTGQSCDANGDCAIGLTELNSIYNVVGINPAAVAVFADAASKYPVNDDTVGDGFNTGGFRFNAPASVRQNTHIARFDFNINDKQILFTRLNYQWDNSVLPSAFPDTLSPTSWSHPAGFVVGHTWTATNNLINNFRYGLTRQAFTNTGDSEANAITFRFVFSPLLFGRTLSRTTETHNFIDDITWIKGNHTLQFGTNIRLIRNHRDTLASAFDTAVTNPSFYSGSGRSVSNELLNNGYTFEDRNVVQSAATALIGRFSQYTGRFNYDINGNVLSPGTNTVRNFATEEYDFYVQDSWKPFRNLTVTGGLRYALSRPVYEQDGFQVVPDVRLGDYFDRRVASAAQGVPLNDNIQFQVGGPKNNAPGFYSMDTNNFQPSIAVAWSPSFESGFLKGLFGSEGDSTIRGGFRITNDYFGSQLAVSFDGLSTLGFTTSDTIAANTFDVTSNPGPLFTGFGQDVRSLPNISAPNRFMTPADGDQRIETSLDATIQSPIHYTWNLSYGRNLPKGAYFEASYIGRAARNLFATRDVMALNNLVDPVSGMDWYTAAGLLDDLRNANTPNANVSPIPYFENLFPGAIGLFGAPGTTATQGVYNLVSRIDGFDIKDYTFVQLLIDDVGIFPNAFFHPQYAAFSAYGTTAYSDYHGATFSLRQRLGNTLSYDFNYTFSKSMDNASGLQTGNSFGSAFILNALRPDDNYSLSDFDTKHNVNANFIFQLPIGKGRSFFSNMNSFADAIVGGWQLAGVFRWNSGLPISPPFDGAQWATNWNVQSNGVRLGDIPLADGGADRSTRNIFSDPQAAFNLFRNARPGETGDRNVFRLPGFSTLDLGLSKSFTMPWNENHNFQFRWEVFNVANAQTFTPGNQTRSTYGLGQDPELNTAASNFGEIYNAILGSPRSMQFGFRYTF